MKKYSIYNRGSAGVWLLVIVTVVLVGGGVYYYKTSTAVDDASSTVETITVDDTDSADTSADTVTNNPVVTKKDQSNACGYISDAEVSSIVGIKVVGVEKTPGSFKKCFYEHHLSAVDPDTGSDVLSVVIMFVRPTNDADMTRLNNPSEYRENSITGIGDRANSSVTFYESGVLAVTGNTTISVRINTGNKGGQAGNINLEIAKKVARAVISNLK
jgi:hypothetical protein